MSTAESGRATASMSAVQGQLFEALFPGQQYSDDRAGELAARLRSLADELQPSAAQQQVQEEDGPVGGPRKKRRKDKDSKGELTCHQISACWRIGGMLLPATQQKCRELG